MSTKAKRKDVEPESAGENGDHNKKHHGKNGATNPASSEPCAESKGDPHANQSKEDLPKMALGAVCHLEFPANDLTRVRGFFEKVFDWKFTPWGDMYATWIAGSPKCLQGGVFLTSNPIKDVHQTVPNLLAEHIPSKLQEIHDAGGVVLRPMTLISNEIGSHAHFRDTEGNHWGLFSPKFDPEEVAAPIEQKVHFTTLSPSAVYRLLTDSETHSKAVGMKTVINPVVLGDMKSEFLTARFVELVPDHRLVLSWTGANFPKGHFTNVEIDITHDKSGGSFLELKHSYVPAKMQEVVSNGWFCMFWDRFGEGKKAKV